MIEVELKFRLVAPEELLAQLLARGAVPLGETIERDTYFSHPVRDFAKTNEALRIRWDGREATMTYKGPLMDAVSKTREEYQLEFASEDSLEEAAKILERLNFKQFGSVEKRRTSFHLSFQNHTVTVSIDDVLGLGVFIELETLADEDSWEQARNALQALAASLGLTDPQRRSYLELLGERPA
jgi:adenylate cyclase class 2